MTKFVFAALLIVSATACSEQETKWVGPSEAYFEHGVLGYEFPTHQESPFFLIHCRLPRAGMVNIYMVTVSTDRIANLYAGEEYPIPQGAYMGVLYEDGSRTFYQYPEGGFSLSDFMGHIRENGSDQDVIKDYVESRLITLHQVPAPDSQHTD